MITALRSSRTRASSSTVDREVLRIRDGLIPEYASLVYRGFWFAPEREMPHFGAVFMAIPALAAVDLERLVGTDLVSASGKFSITVDGNEVYVPEGTNLVKAAKKEI